MNMNDEQFEQAIKLVETRFPKSASALRARDTAQREALARVEADREFLNGHSELIRLHASKLQADLDTAQAQLAEAVGLLHEFAAAQEAKRQGVSNAQRAAGISRLVVVEERVVAFLARHAQAEQQEALSDAELMEVAMFERSGNKAARRASFLGAAELPEHLAPWQEAQDAQAGDERSTAEQAYVADAFDYSAAPIGSRDWTLYWKGWQARAALATQPAVSVSAEAMSFEYAHISGERRTVSITREDVIEGMEDTLYEKLSDQICRCEPIGETNVVECNCQDYIEEFALVAAKPAVRGAEHE